MRVVDLFESEFLTEKDKIFEWMEKSFHDFDPNLLKIESDGLIYDGDLSLMKNVDRLKVQFKEVTDYFHCDNTLITSLVGFPVIVGREFSSSYTNITSLKFCPKSVGGYFSCSNNKITNPREYRFALYCEIGDRLYSGIKEIDEIINAYKGSANRKYWPHAINLLSRVKL